MPEKRLAHLSIFLVKKTVTTVEDIIRTQACEPSINVPISGTDGGKLFLRRSPGAAPRWTLLFADVLQAASVAIPGISAAFVIQVKQRFFVLVFGAGGRFLLQENVHEERFGLLCALNSVDPKSFRSVDVQSLDAIQSHTRIQSGEATTPDQFGLDVEQDMLKAIVGAPSDPGLGSRMTGHDSLSVSVRADLSDLPYLLNEYRKNFEAELSAADHEWVNNIAMVKNGALIASLEAELAKSFGAKDFTSIWLAIPEMIDWATVKGFTYTNGGKEAHSDINMAGFLKTVAAGQKITTDLMKARRAYCVDADHQKTFKDWPVYKCLYAEVDLNGAKYILNDGQWFCVDGDFVSRTNTDFATIQSSKLTLPEYSGGGEGAYNVAVAGAEPTRFALLDQDKVSHGGGHGQVEICDLLSKDKELIHVKIYGKSSVFSHLFAQGFVSGQLIQIDSTFRKKVKDKLKGPYKSLISVANKPAPNEFTIVYAVISEEEGDDLHLPFFSRVNLNNTRKILEGFGYRVELLKIAVDEKYAKTVTLPPMGKKAKKAT